MSRARENADGARLDAPLASPDFTGTVDLTGTTVSLDDDEISLDKVSGGTLGTGTIGGTSVVNTSGAITTTGTATFSGDLVPSSPLSNRNYIINGGFDVWQRGESFTADADDYGADRWQITRENQTVTKVVATPVGNVRCHAMKMLKTGTGAITAYNVIEDGPVLAGTDNGSRFNGKTLTLSFYAKANTSIVNSGQVWLYHASTSTQVATTSDTFTTSWVKYTHTFTMPTNTETYTTPVKKLVCSVVRALDSAVGDTDWIEIAQVQLEEGSNATPFEHRSYGEELQRCERYYWRWTSAAYPYAAFCMGQGYDASNVNGVRDFPTTMRIAPSFAVSNATHFWWSSSTNNTALTSISQWGASVHTSILIIEVSSGTAGYIRAGNTTSAWAEYKAEL